MGDVGLGLGTDQWVPGGGRGQWRCSGERAEVGLSAQGDAAVGSKRGVVVGGVGGCVVEVERMAVAVALVAAAAAR